MKTTTMKMFISIASLAFFLIFSMGSLEPYIEEFLDLITPLRIEKTTEYLGNDIYRETDKEIEEGNNVYSHSVTTGKKNKNGIWDGPYRKVQLIEGGHNISYISEGVMVNGVMHGQWFFTRGTEITTVCYDTGKKIPCDKKTTIIQEALDAFIILEEQYYWYLFTLYGYELTDEQIGSFIGRIEEGLAEYEFDMEDFDTYYDWALDDIEEDPGDHEPVFKINALRAMFEGMGQLKFFALRYAVIEHFRSPGNSTYDIIKRDHPGFIDQVINYEEVEATEQDFALFCADLDGRMASPGPLDMEDPFFADSVDVRMFRAFYDIMKEIQSSASPGKLLKAASLLQEAKSYRQMERMAAEMLKQMHAEKSAQNAALVVANLMGQQYAKGDIIRQCVKEAWQAGGGNGGGNGGGGNGGGNGGGTETGLEPLIAYSYFPWLTTSKYVMFRQHPEGGYVAAGYGTTNVSDIFIARYSDKGDTLWTRRHAPPEGTVARWPLGGDMAAGGFYLLTINLKHQIQWNEVMFFSLNGDSVWSTPVSEIQQWSGLPFAAIRTTPDGGCVVAGGSNGFPSAATIKKLSKEGTIDWVANDFTGDYGYNWFYDVDVNADGEVFATGRVQNNVNGRQSFLVAKVSATGTKLWDEVHYSGLATAGDSIVGAGNSVVAADDGGCIAGGIVTTPGKAGRVVMKRFDSTGKTIWDNKYHRFAEDGTWQNAQVYDILPHTGGNYLALIHQFDGSSGANPTLMKFTPQGDTLWTQYGMDRRWRISGTDNNNNILICGDLPLAQAGFWEHATLVRATSGGIFYPPECKMPYDRAVNLTDTPTLEWSVPYHKGTFKVQLSTDSTFTQINHEWTTEALSLATPQLNSFTTYYWRVQIRGAEGAPSAWSKTFRFTVKDFTATKEGWNNAVIRVYPNPADDLLFVELLKPMEGKCFVEIIGLNGQIHTTQAFEGYPSATRLEIPLKHVKSGHYILRIHNQRDVITRKIIVR